MKKNKNENNNHITPKEIIQELKEIHKKIDSIYEFSRGMIGMDEAARFLNISKGYLYQLTATNQIPFHKRAKLNYFVVEELIEWVKKEEHEKKNETVVEDARIDQLMLEKFK